MANIEARYKEIKKGLLGYVTIVDAAKTRTIEEIREAIDAGTEISLGRTMLKKEVRPYGDFRVEKTA